MTIKAEQIPDAVVEAAMRVLATRGGTRAAILAALNAWPGMGTNGSDPLTKPAYLILPLTAQETPDGK